MTPERPPPCCDAPECEGESVGRILVMVPLDRLGSTSALLRTAVLPTVEKDGRKLKVVSQVFGCRDHFEALENAAMVARPQGTVVYVERGLIQKTIEDERVLH